MVKSKVNKNSILLYGGKSTSFIISEMIDKKKYFLTLSFYTRKMLLSEIQIFLEKGQK